MAATAAPPARPSAEGFAPLDWALVAGVAVTWGGSFLLIDIGVDHFDPGLVAFLRVLFGALTLAAIPAARLPVAREDMPKTALLGVVWMAVPFVLFPVAEQWIDSSLAGMLNAAAPLFTAVVAAMLARALPPGRQAAGLLIGFAGVVAVTLPSVDGAEASALGAGLVLLAAFLYGIAFNLTGPLQARNGVLPVLWRAQLISLALTAPVGLASVPGSSFAWSSLLACLVLGSAGTALAYVWFTTLVARVGAPRGSIAIYFLPVVAILLGAIARDETIAVAAIFGTGLILAGAYVTSRSGRRP